MGGQLRELIKYIFTLELCSLVSGAASPGQQGAGKKSEAVVTGLSRPKKIPTLPSAAALV